MRQHFINQKYTVIFDEYSERHFIKDFEKKYKTNWDITRKSIKECLELIYNLSGTSCIDLICASNKNTILVKYDFRVAKTNTSSKSSGNRCIIEVNNSKLEVRILLVYGKCHLDCPRTQETIWWKEALNNNFKLCCS